MSPPSQLKPALLVSMPLLALVVVGLPALLTFFGAWRMKRLQGYGLAVTASILALITPPGMLVGLVFGIWALVMLARRDVQAAFQREKSPASGKGCLIACGILIGVVLLAVLTIFGLWMLLS